MHPLVAAKLPEIHALCRRHHVRRLDLVGSATGPDFDPARSDLDFVVEFLPVPRRGLQDVYFKLLFDLQDLLGRPVDLIEARAIRNPYFSASIEESREPVYAAA